MRGFTQWDYIILGWTAKELSFKDLVSSGFNLVHFVGYITQSSKHNFPQGIKWILHLISLSPFFGHFQGCLEMFFIFSVYIVELSLILFFFFYCSWTDATRLKSECYVVDFSLPAKASFVTQFSANVCCNAMKCRHFHPTVTVNHCSVYTASALTACVHIDLFLATQHEFHLLSRGNLENSAEWLCVLSVAMTDRGSSPVFFQRWE